MNTVVVAFQEKILVKGDAAVGTSIKLHHPTADAIRIKLLVPCGIKRVGKIDSLAVALTFPHLRAARERLIGLLRMRRPIGDAADAHRGGLFRIEWIRNIVLQKLACSPARNVKELVIQG